MKVYLPRNSARGIAYGVAEIAKRYAKRQIDPNTIKALTKEIKSTIYKQLWLNDEVNYWNILAPDVERIVDLMNPQKTGNEDVLDFYAFGEPGDVPVEVEVTWL